MSQDSNQSMKATVFIFGVIGVALPLRAFMTAKVAKNQCSKKHVVFLIQPATI